MKQQSKVTSFTTTTVGDDIYNKIRMTCQVYAIYKSKIDYRTWYDVWHQIRHKIGNHVMNNIIKELST